MFMAAYPIRSTPHFTRKENIKFAKLVCVMSAIVYVFWKMVAKYTNSNTGSWLTFFGRKNKLTLILTIDVYNQKIC